MLHKSMDDEEALARKSKLEQGEKSMSQLMDNMDDGGDTLQPLASVPAATPLGMPPAQAGQYPSAQAQAAAAPREDAYSEYSEIAPSSAMVDNEPEHDRQRRIEWIKYYVRTGEPDKAYELGWDGLPFQIAAPGTGSNTDLTRI